jgi:hypothetical protein
VTVAMNGSRSSKMVANDGVCSLYVVPKVKVPESNTRLAFACNWVRRSSTRYLLMLLRHLSRGIFYNFKNRLFHPAQPARAVL